MRRRRSRRKRPVGRSIYSIHYLLDKQPKTLSRDSRYTQMISYYRSSPALQKIRFNRRCFSLLNDAVIEPAHLMNFYRTYRLPHDPFFPLFFMIKRSFLANKAEKKIEKALYIKTRMNQLPPSVIQMLTLVLEIEEKYNRSDRALIYRDSLFPKTKKQVDMYIKFSHSDWFLFFKKHFSVLRKEYERLTIEKTDQLLACFTLDCLPDNFKGSPDKSLIKRRYRNYSKIYHPDMGGAPELFIAIKWAHDILLGDQ